MRVEVNLKHGRHYNEVKIVIGEGKKWVHRNVLLYNIILKQKIIA